MSGQTAVVTGAASGIGLECTKLLIERGYKIAALDLRADAIRSAHADAGDRVHAIGVDIADIERSRQAIAEAEDVLGPIDAFLHFAAVWTGKTWTETEPDEWPRVLAVNVTGAFFITRAIAERMAARGRGSIVLTASDSAKVGGVAGGPAYVASKGAIIGLTRSLAKSLGPKGVRVNAINPGVVDTPMTKSWPAAIKERAVELTPLGRLARPDDVAAVACFLASEDARFVTGEVIEVNGGFYFD